MKKLALSSAAMLLAASAYGQTIIGLPTPHKDAGMTLYQALAQRASVREFSGKEVSEATLSELLWAANGINREDGRLTAPTAMNTQEICLYVCREDGAYLFTAKDNCLTQVSGKDLRKDIAGRQGSVAEAPYFIVIVADLAKYRRQDDKTAMFGAMDAGYVSQNICLACEALGLSTVPRYGMDQEVLRKELGLTDAQQLMLNHPVGYRK